ncbi:MAG: ABC transporter substrate-binding protein [Comamonas sp.]
MPTNKLSRRQILKTGATAGALFAIPALAQQHKLTVISERSNVNTRAALAKIASDFEKQTGVAVAVNNMDHEAHKTAIRNYLIASPPDVCFWFSGSRMRSFVKRGLFEDISDLFVKEKYKDVLGSAADAVTVNGKQYGLPTSAIPWGLFYRQDVFSENGLTVPKTWEDLKTMADAAKAKGLIPMAMGTKELWPAAGWFDHMNLRINGLDQHMALMNGDMSYLDSSLTPVFDRWEELIKAGFFLPNGTSYTWQQSAAFLVQKKAAMMDLAPFISGVFPEAERSQIGFALFPEIVPGSAPYEDLAYNSVHIPSGSQNKQLARDFLAFFYRPENLGEFLRNESGIPPRSDVKTNPDPLLEQVRAAFKDVKGAAQYYDRDTDPDMAQIGLNGFQEFSVAPERRKAIQERLEAARKRIFAKA